MPVSCPKPLVPENAWPAPPAPGGTRELVGPPADAPGPEPAFPSWLEPPPAPPAPPPAMPTPPAPLPAPVDQGVAAPKKPWPGPPPSPPSPPLTWIAPAGPIVMIKAEIFSAPPPAPPPADMRSPAELPPLLPESSIVPWMSTEVSALIISGFDPVAYRVAPAATTSERKLKPPGDASVSSVKLVVTSSEVLPPPKQGSEHSGIWLQYAQRTEGSIV
eukprot:scaffold36306_cov62-Phaeocystis_antarctica.AAC.6